MESEDLIVLKFSTPNFIRTIGAAVANGKRVLIDDVKETLDPAIDPILLKSNSG